MQTSAWPCKPVRNFHDPHRLASQWPYDFGAHVTLTNVGNPATAWTVVWSCTSGQQVTQAWNATVTQIGAQATAKNADYNSLPAPTAPTPCSRSCGSA